MQEVGNHDGVYLAMQIYHQLKLTGKALLVGENYMDRSLVTRLMCSSCGNPYMEMNSLTNSIDPASHWHEFLRTAINTALESWKPIVIFIKLSEILTDYQWRDISSIVQWGWVYHEILFEDGILTDIAHKKMTEHGYPLDELNLLIDHIKSSRMIRVVLSHDSKASSRSLAHFLYTLPALRSAPAINISKWKPETIAGYSFNITRQANAPWINEFLIFMVEVMHKLPVMEKDIGGVYVQAANTSLKTTLHILADLLAFKGKELDAKIAKLSQAIYASDKMLSAIVVLNTEFEKATKHLTVNDHDTQEYLKNLEYERETRDRIAVEIQIIGDAAQRATVDYESLEAQYAIELARVAPALEAASKNIDELKKNDIYEVRSMMNPPKGVLLVLECLLIIFRVDMRGPEGIWEQSKKLISEVRFVQRIVEFDKDSLTNSIMSRVGAILKQPDFTQENLSNVSKAISCLGGWIISLKAYNEAMTAFEPKKRLIQEQRSKCKYYTNEVSKNQKKLDISEATLGKLRSRFDAVIKFKENVAKTHKDIQEKHKIAQILGETIQICKDRYRPAVEELRLQKTLIFTDSLLNACFAAYLGPYSKSVRAFAKNELQEWLRTNEIPFTEYVSLSHYYTKPTDIFTTNDIVPDLFNLDNAVIARLSKEIPLLLEGSQCIAQWILVLEAQNNPTKISTYDSNWRESLIASMRTETPVIMSIFLAKPDAFLETLLKTTQFCRMTRKKCFIEWGGESIEIHKEFRLYLLLNRPLNLVPKEWLDYSTPISCYLDQDQVAEILLDNSLADYASTLRGISSI
jgi:dynein heavy chain